MKRALFLAGISLCAAAAVFPGLVGGGYLPVSNEGVFGASDLLDVNLPLRAFAGRTLASGRLPLWFPGCYGGVSLSSVPEAAPFYPPSSLFYMMFGPARATAWSLAFHLVLAGTGLGLFAGRLGARLPGEALAAACAAAGLWLPDHFRQMNLLEAAAWTPWALWAADLCLDSPDRRTAARLGFILGMAALAGHLQIFHHTLVGLSVWGGLRIAPTLMEGWRTGEPIRRAPLLQAGASLALAAFIALALAAPHLLPMIEAIGLASRAGAVDNPAKFSSLATLVQPTLFGSPADGSLRMKSVFWEEAQYIGLLPLALALGALASGAPDRGRRRIALALAGLILASVLLAYGRNIPIFRAALRAIPGYSLFRFPQRYLWLCSLALAAAAGLGLDRLIAFAARRSPRAAPILAAAAILITILDLRLRVRPLCPTGDADALIAEPATAARLREAGARPEAFAERVAAHGAWDNMMKVLKAGKGWSGPREPWVELARLMSFQRPSLYGWQTARGYVGLPPHWAALAVEDQHDPGLLLALEWQKKTYPELATAGRWAKWAGTLGAKWILSTEPLDDPLLEPLGEVPGETLTIHIYKNQAWLGPAWLARKALRGRTDPEIENFLFFKVDDFAAQIVSTEPLQSFPDPPPGSEADAILSVEAPRPERIDVKCKLASPGWLVVSLGFHPRWRATLGDGSPLLVERVNLSQTAILLPQGEHSVSLEFDGWLEKLSLVLAAAGALGAAAALRKRERKSKHADQGDDSAEAAP